MQRKPADAAQKAEADKLKAHLNDMDAIAGSASGRHKALMEYAGGDGTAKVDEIAGKFVSLTKMYKTAYDRYAAKMKDAGQDAALADGVRDAVIGVAIGIGVGLSMPEVAAATGAIGVFKAVAKEGKGELFELGIGKALSVAIDINKAPLDTNAALAPEVQQLKQASALIDMYRNIALTTAGAGLFLDTALAAKDLKADITAFVAGEGDKSGDKLGALVSALIGFDDTADTITTAKAGSRAKPPRWQSTRVKRRTPRWKNKSGFAT